MIGNNEDTGAAPPANGESPPISEPAPTAPPPVGEDNQFEEKPKWEYDETLKEGQTLAADLSGATKDWFNQHGGEILALLLASFLLLVKASADLGQKNYVEAKQKRQLGFAVAVGLISFVLTASYMIAKKKDKIQPKHHIIFVCFQFVWWAIAVGVLTFGAIYNTTGNGYFATWGGFFFAASLFQAQMTQTAAMVNKFRSLGFHIGTLVVCSVVVFFASLGPCGNDCSGSHGFALSVGIVSAVFLLILIFADDKLPDKAKVIIAAFFVIWWTLAVFICTFISPFTTTGNGYFGCWIGLIASAMMYAHVRKATVQQQDTAEPDHIDMV